MKDILEEAGVKSVSTLICHTLNINVTFCGVVDMFSIYSMIGFFFFLITLRKRLRKGSLKMKTLMRTWTWSPS